ncbi:unnamed protein product [Linum tenue]|uniref:Uncharacterized protein n=1 Tax=Linum tenue TaxID=586396 RepID=A0AAV0JA65_9ROSI|nr:unnamed protein product [Linum tenue]
MVSVNLGMLHYVLDHIYGAVMHRSRLGTPFFSKGWGGTQLALLERMVHDLFPELEARAQPPSMIQPIWRTIWESRTACLREGVFKTPCDEQLISALPPESHTARVAFLAPKLGDPQRMACVVHLAGTGDHTYERRLRLAGPLLKENIATMVLESPFYGQRRPMMQQGAKLLCVSDLLLLGRATIEEARSLLYWLDSEAGFGKLGICGLSMGKKPLILVCSLPLAQPLKPPFLSVLVSCLKDQFLLNLRWCSCCDGGIIAPNTCCNSAFPFSALCCCGFLRGHTTTWHCLGGTERGSSCTKGCNDS